MAESPLYQFTSHILGKNAKVAIYVDRIEWEKPRGVSGGKITAAAFTGGTSLLFTGVKNGKHGTEVIPVKAISSVTTKRDGMLNTIVSVITVGNTIDMRVSHKEAAVVKEVLTDLMLGKHVTQQEIVQAEQQAAISEPVPAPAPAVDHTDALVKLASLRDAGILTDEEFAAKKAELLSRI
ncbi:SHOCT domain-containing protein [Leifsonia aquatica]|uniref:SHOCT domain-containing protein n=1 Tax=Leifsonia aquatica TaxID=144185 RepID=UPI0004683D78|nr:SHOCT domain-containing protein [Leifsonia aquatica]